MSRSCQSGTFSSPTSADARTTRASPEIRSATFGLRLCGIADEPFIPVANGSSTSRTSVRARCRISVAKRSSDVATSASVESSSAWRSRAITCVETGSGSSPSRSHADPLDLGLDRRVRADRARELADAVRLERAQRGACGRGRARTPSRRASSRTSSARRGSRASGRCRSCAGAPAPRRTTASSARSSSASTSAPASRICSDKRRVDDVRRGEAVVEPPPLRAELLGHRVDERGRVVVGDPLDLGDALGRRRRPPRARIAATSSAGNRADLGPPVERRELHLEPVRQLALLRPDSGHGRSRVAGDHAASLDRRSDGPRSSRPSRDAHATSRARRSRSRRP